MSIWRLTIREISHRKVHFALGLLSITAAIAAYIATTMLLRDSAHRDRLVLVEMEAHQKKHLANFRSDLEKTLDGKRTKLEKALAEKQAGLLAQLQEREKVVAEAGVALQDAMRKITKGLGFNVLILPRDQDINQYHLSGVADAVMPEAFVTKLANSKIVTINHLLPVVTRRIRWTEQDNLEVVLIGTRGEVPLAHRDPKKPLLDIVPKGKLIAGHEVGKKLGLKKNQRVKLLGREFEVAKIHAERGSLDDSSIWLNLTEAQELLKMQNVVNAILALECNCATVDRVKEIRAELAGILPGTQIIERGSKALARAEARNKAKQQADTDLKEATAAARKILTEQIEHDNATLDAQLVDNDKAIHKQAAKGQSFLTAEQTKRQRLQGQKERFAAILIPLAVAAAAIWIALLMYGNARRRQSEIGILRAIGLRTGQVLTLLLGKAFYLGLLGAGLGIGAGLVLGLAICEINWGEAQARQLVEPGNLWLAAAMAPLIAMLGSLLPAMMAVRRDPAMVLQEE